MAWYHRLANLVRSRRLSRDLDREISFHLAERVDELVAGGMSREEAERAARRRFGNPTALKERTRDVDVLGWLESVLADLRYAARALRRSPGFAAVAILSLGLGIGANTAIFGIVDAVMLRSLPVLRPQELLQVNFGAGRGDTFTNPLWEEIRDRQDVFDGIFAYSNQEFDLAAGGEARRTAGAFVGGAFFETLGVRPAAGRLLAAGDDVRGCPGVAVLGHGLWQSEYGADPGILGRSISLDGHPMTIVGVAAREFSGIEVGRATQLYVPLCAESILRGEGSALDERSHWFLAIVGRPKEGLTPAAVGARLTALSPEILAATLPADWDARGRDEYLGWRFDVQPASNGLSQLRLRYRDALVALMGAVGVVLLIACANVANLLLARATARQREIGVRFAIGAGRRRIVRQLLTESLLLSLLGAAVGVLFARWGSDLLVRLLSTRETAVWLDLAIDVRVLAFTTAVAMLTGILFGLAPAWRATRVSPQAAMRAHASAAGDGRTRLLVPKTLVVAQLALSVVLVAAAGLLVGSFRTLATLDAGFARDGVLLVEADMRNAGIPEDRLRDVQHRMLDELRTIPGVLAASASELTPVSGMGWNGPLQVEGLAASDFRERMVFFNAVSEDYFETMGTALLAGREIGPGDVAGAPRVAVVNRAMARKFFGDGNPVGRTFVEERPDGVRPPVEVVGVVEDAKYMTLREAPRPVAYLSLRQNAVMHPGVYFELRTAGAPAGLVPRVVEVIGRQSPSVSLTFRTLADQVAASLARERLLATLSGAFGALALLLAMVGLYGTMSYSVARRSREFGIRIALGAVRPRLLRMVFGEVGRLALLGVALGALGALGASRIVESFLYGVSATDPLTLALAAATLVLVALVAGIVPAWRVARLDPVTALREE